MSFVSNLNITVSEGKGLVANGSVEPFIEIKAPSRSGPIIELKCKSLNQTLNPVWLNTKQPNLSTLTIVGITKVDIKQNKYSETPIIVNVYTSESKQDLIGTATIPLTTALQSKTVSQWFPLYSSSKPNQIQGEIKLELFLNDPDLSQDQLNQHHSSLRLSSERLKTLQDTFKSQSSNQPNHEISTVSELIQVFKSTHLLETLITSLTLGSSSQQQDQNLTSILLSDDEFITQICTDYFSALDIDHSNSISYDELLHGLNRTLSGSNSDNLRLHFQCCASKDKKTINRTQAKKLSFITMALFRATVLLAVRVTIENEKKMYPEEKKHYEEIYEKVMEDVRREVKEKKDLGEAEVRLMWEYCGKKEDEEVSEDEFVRWALDEGQAAKRMAEINGLLVAGGKAMRKSIKKHSDEIWDREEKQGDKKSEVK